jgi:hypothetical protein
MPSYSETAASNREIRAFISIDFILPALGRPEEGLFLLSVSF